MNFLRPLAALCLACTLQAQTIDAQATGGGELKIGARTYRFELKALFTAPPKGGLPGAFRFQGRLVPTGSEQPFDLDLTVLKTGTLYMLRIDRKGVDSYPESWAATLKTRIRPISMKDGPGGRVEVECLGTLSGIIARKPQVATWQGRIWATFPGEALRR
ncbi:hypothetical protein [Geothrix fuzhouensis]|uniref:hypothetical protein n=1 Tax=Geothrix fuzhouensis TaxID=2966451 RepID=UPI0021487619|nr:hypothetical protein [Geothrix fuzhouensis]